MFRLRNVETRVTYQAEETIDLKRGQKTIVVAEVKAPPGVYEPEVRLEYPVSQRPRAIAIVEYSGTGIAPSWSGINASAEDPVNRPYT